MTEVILILDGQSLKVKIKIDKYSFLLTSFLVFFYIVTSRKTLFRFNYVFEI